MSQSTKFWDREADKADRQDASLGGPEIRTVEITQKYLRGSDAVLDYACGTGAITLHIARSVTVVHAIDLSARMGQVLNERARNNAIKNIRFIQGTLADAPYADGSLDVIMAFNILHLLEDPRTTIHKVQALLRPGGYFISATACLGESRWLGLFLSLLSKTGLVPYANRLTPASLGDMMTGEGFTIIETESLEPMNILIVARK